VIKWHKQHETGGGVAKMIEAYRQLVKKIQGYEEAIGLMHWDLRTGAPRKAASGRSEVIGMLSGEMFQLQTSDQMRDFIQHLLSTRDKLSQIDVRAVEESERIYKQSKKIPQGLFEKYVTLTAEAESIWEEAKQKHDWEQFAPYLSQIVAFNKQFVELWGYDEHPYDALLDMFEPGMTVAQLNPIFEQLRVETIAILNKINDVNHSLNRSIRKKKIDKEAQMAFSTYMLEQMGYDFDAGRLDYSAHPFATGLNLGDVRITTNVIEDDFTFALFSSIHEGGHAIYEQNISSDLMGTPLCTGTSMGIHESQSRLWENQIGRSRAFWKKYWPIMQSQFPEAFGSEDEEIFYRALNEVKPSLIRIEADELTYNLHILIRYEIEKALIEGSISVDELPRVWDEKYEAYLGVRPSHVGEGVLQDVHWSGGAFGYFPSYTLGNMYASQFISAMYKQIPELDKHIENGELHVITSWLNENIHQYGKLKSPAELIQDVTGEPLNPTYFIQYLHNKYNDIYGV
jgi:carboxypeptidase Taq